MKYLVTVLLVIVAPVFAQTQSIELNDVPAPSSELNFFSITSLKDYLREVRSKFTVAQAPIYRKGASATAEELANYKLALTKLAELQFYLAGKYTVKTIHERRYYYYSSSRASYRIIYGGEEVRGTSYDFEKRKIAETYEKCLYPQVTKLNPPFTREDLNAASKVANAMGDLMSLKVKLMTADSPDEGTGNPSYR